MTYRCKRVGRAIQKTIRYFPSEGEFVSIHMTSLRLIPPEGQQLPDKPFKTIDITKEPDGSILLDQDLLANQFHTAAGYEIPLDGFSDIENLGVDLQVSYTIRRDRFIGWGMSEPTKGFDLLVVTDNDIHVEYEVFGLASGDIDCDRGLHYLRLRSSSWIQPDAGIAIQLSAPHDRGCGPEQQGKPATEAVTDTKPAPPAKQEDPAN